ncbi:hypothetical protein IFT62_03870 [Pseudomonas lutea]|uniref:Uncharacterized protein n=1 Tax=Pseudomonas lutea TaxID=243924 RepID=A0ABR9A2U4_9PSED|nr:hypothetical protein [Pseudomonas lutea]MBD8120341.1 hypothetical protein [Pseudomonas lutea]
MYFSLMRPELMKKIGEFAGGLLVVMGDKSSDHRPTLIIKTHKEVILTARLQKGFKFYLAPCEAGGVSGLSLISAFFDDTENPLTINSPLNPGASLTLAFAEWPDEFDVCFFDDHSRELLSCRATATLQAFRSRILREAKLSPSRPGEMHDQAEQWFSTRNPDDDRQAFLVTLGDELFPSSFVHLDARDDQHAFHGSIGFSKTSLVRDDPGPPQERDIIFLLQRVFAPGSIIHGPIKIAGRDELADVVVLGDEVNILVQAKDSPNTVEMLTRTLDKKKSRSLHQLKEALSQLGGSISSVRRDSLQHLKLATGDEIHIDFTGKPVVGIVIIRELFSDSYEEYSERAFTFMEKYQMPVVFFDYPEFNMLTRHCTSEQQLISACDQVLSHAHENGMYPKMRF